MNSRNVFDQLRHELQQLRQLEQPDFGDANLMRTDEFGNITGYKPTEEEQQELAESSVQKQLLDKVEKMIDRVESRYNRRMRAAFAPPWLYRRRRNYFYVGEESIGKTHSLFREHQDQLQERFADLEDYDWVFPTVDSGNDSKNTIEGDRQ